MPAAMRRLAARVGSGHLLRARQPAELLRRTYKRMPNMHVPQQLPGAPPPKRIGDAAALAQQLPAAAAREAPAVSPAMCAMHLTPVADRRRDFEVWLQEGREVLSATLAEERAPSSIPSARLLLGNSTSEPESAVRYSEESRAAAAAQAMERCFHWIHVPSQQPGVQPDLVAIIFTSESDLAIWRASTARAEWLRRGESLARKVAAPTSLDGSPALAAMAESMAADAPAASSGATGVGAAATATSSGESFVKDTHAFSFVRDDGSLGGWLPADGKNGDVEAPAPWKVAATVLPAMYAMQEVNRLLLMPGLDVASPNAWGSLPPSAQLFVACAFAAGGTTFVLLPYARQFTESIGLIKAAAPKAGQSAPPPPPLSRSMPPLLLAYALLIGAGVVASHLVATNAPYRFERLGKLTPFWGPAAVSGVSHVGEGGSSSSSGGGGGGGDRTAGDHGDEVAVGDGGGSGRAIARSLSSGSGLQQRLRGAMTMKSAESD